MGIDLDIDDDFLGGGMFTNYEDIDLGDIDLFSDGVEPPTISSVNISQNPNDHKSTFPSNSFKPPGAQISHLPQPSRNFVPPDIPLSFETKYISPITNNIHLGIGNYEEFLPGRFLYAQPLTRYQIYVIHNQRMMRTKSRKKIRRHGAVKFVQIHCCIKGCDNKKLKRTRFCLKLNQELKRNFINKGMDKICDQCYFKDRYRNKKKESELRDHYNNNLLYFQPKIRKKYF